MECQSICSLKDIENKEPIEFRVFTRGVFPSLFCFFSPKNPKNKNSYFYSSSSFLFRNRVSGPSGKEKQSTKHKAPFTVVTIQIQHLYIALYISNSYLPVYKHSCRINIYNVAGDSSVRINWAES